MNVACGRCGNPMAIDADDDMRSCIRCLRTYSDIAHGYMFISDDPAIEELGMCFQLNLANAWWEAGS